MWRRAYFLLILIRLYFAISPSYLHPDEHFQGPEVLFGKVFHQDVHETWEFSSEAPIRSAFALWPVYGLPMLLLRSILGSDVSSKVVFTTLRLVMFCLSFVLEDWALHELVESGRHRRTAILLVASSYVTWTWQVHTFSNAVETVLVLWSLVLIKRVERDNPSRPSLLAPAALAFVLIFGTFNRITFPAFVALPLARLTPVVVGRPFVLGTMLLIGIVTTLLAILVDTFFYSQSTQAPSAFISSPVFTPLNSLRYNTQAANLALHGVHPFYQHFMVNLPQMLGPALIPLLTGYARSETQLTSALAGTAILSCFSHQEARFLLPAVPLILSSVTIPQRVLKAWVAVWVLFNLALGVLMGVYHQGGVVPAQIYLSTQTNVTQAFWWKTYSPPQWLLGERNSNVRTVDLMGLNEDMLQERICVGAGEGTVLVAPRSADFLTRFIADESDSAEDLLQLQERWQYSGHLNLDDLDFGGDGVVPTLQRVVGQRGIAVWDVRCPQARGLPDDAAYMHRDW